MIIPSPGMSIISSDFDQVELRIAAAMSGEQSMIDAAKRGESLHVLTATKLWGKDYTPDEYKRAKNINFTWVYGGGAGNMAAQYGISLEAAQELVNSFSSAFPTLATFKRREQKEVLKLALTQDELTAYYEIRREMFNCPDTPAGRKARTTLRVQLEALTRRRVAWITTPYGRRLPVEANKAYKVVNYKIQSTAREIMADALLDVMADFELEPTVLLPVHDELIGEAPRSKAERIARRYGEVMSRDFMGVPLTASGTVYGKSWGHGYMKKDR